MAEENTQVETPTTEEEEINPRAVNRRNKEERKILNDFFASEEIMSLIKTKPKGYIDEIRRLLKEAHDLDISKVAVYRRINRINKPPIKKPEIWFDICVEEDGVDDEYFSDRRSLVKKLSAYPIGTIFTIEIIDTVED